MVGQRHTWLVTALADIPREPLRSPLALLFNPYFPGSRVRALRQGSEMWGQPLVKAGCCQGCGSRRFAGGAQPPSSLQPVPQGRVQHPAE